MSSSFGWIKVESPSGTGHLVRKGNGEKIPVGYKLEFLSGHLPGAPAGKVESKVIGKIEVAHDPGFIPKNRQKHFTLCLEDRPQTIEISIDHGDGTISGAVGDDFY